MSAQCSFCMKPRAAVAKLISAPSASPVQAFICDECVLFCLIIMIEADPSSLAERVVKEILDAVYWAGVESGSQMPVLIDDSKGRSDSPTPKSSNKPEPDPPE